MEPQLLTELSPQVGFRIEPMQIDTRNRDGSISPGRVCH
jgi:hypothetical protein